MTSARGLRVGSLGRMVPCVRDASHRPKQLLLGSHAVVESGSLHLKLETTNGSSHGTATPGC